MKLKKKKNTDYGWGNKYITTKDFNKFTVENFAARLAQANLAKKSNIANFVRKTGFDDKLKKFLEIKQNM